MCLVVGVTSGVAHNWDLLVLAVVVATALVVDLLRGLRERDFAVAGPDGLVVRVRGTTTSWQWTSVTGFGHQPARFGRRRPVVHLVGDTTGRLPREVPLDQLSRWGRELGGSQV